MGKGKFFGVGIFTAPIFLLIFVGLFFTLPEKERINSTLKETDQNMHTVAFFDEKIFYEGVEKVGKEDGSLTHHVSGGIIPHHTFASYFIADFFNRLAKQNPDTIILLGPNHNEKGEYKVMSGLYSWETPFGVVHSNDEIINELLDHDIVGIDEEVLSNDQSIAAIMPFIGFYLPDTKVAPVLVSGFMTLEEVQKLSEILADFLDDDLVVIASVDFSHYLTNRDAQKNDEVTLNMIREHDYKQLFMLNNEYLDSPIAIITLLMIMDSRGVEDMDILHHTNSGEMQNNDSIETTSYFTIAY